MTTGKSLVRVPWGYEHPTDREGQAIPGGHLEALYALSDAEKPCYQVYEDVTEGTPVRPVLESEANLIAWLVAQGYSGSAASAFVREGVAPSFVARGTGEVSDGIETLDSKKHPK